MKAPKGMHITQFAPNVNKEYTCSLQRWSMNGKSGFFIREKEDIKLVEPKLQKVGS